MLPSNRIDIEKWHFLNNFTLADASFAIPGKIDLLLGAELFEEIHLQGVYKPRNNLPTLRKTVFGWIIIGKIQENECKNTRVFNSCVSTLNLSNQLKKFWELEEISQISQDTENICEKLFTKSFKRQEDGRFIVELPFDPLKSNNFLGESRSIAKRRLINMEQKMKINPKFDEAYKKVISEYIDLGHLEKIPECKLKVDIKNSCYLPHHAVLKENSNTTKLQVVFDGSCKTHSGYSLNDLLLCGPVIQENLFSILIRFRFYKVAFVSDIEKMYRMIKIADTHKDYQRVLWRFKPEDPIDEYTCNTVIVRKCGIGFFRFRFFFVFVQRGQ